MKLSINLASRRYLNQRALMFILYCVIAFLIIVLLFQGQAFLNSRQLAHEYQGHLDSLRVQLDGKRPRRLSPEDLVEQRQAYDQAELLLRRDAFRWTALFDRMEKLLPDGISLRSFSPDYAKNSLLLNGVARDLSSLQTLIGKLQADRFEQVYLKNQGEVDVDDGRGGKRTALSFSISLEGVF